MNGQKVFAVLYDWILQEFKRQGVNKGLDMMLNVRTVWGWYRRSEGLQNGQKLDESEMGNGLKILVSNASCIRRDVPKEDRLEVMPADEVHPSFRTRAEQWIGEEVVYLYDVASHPSDKEIVNVCAVPQSFFENICGSDKGEGKSEKLEDAPEAVETVAGPRMAEPELIGMDAVQAVAEQMAEQVDLMHEVSTEIVGDVTVTYEPEPMPRMQERKDDASAMPSEKNEGSEKPLPKPKQKPRVKKNTPNYEERSLFDDLLFEFAKSCHDSEFRCERSAWTGRYVQYYTTSDIKTLWGVGLMVISLVYYFWADWMLDNTDPLELNVVTVFAPFGVALLAWSLFVLWLNNRVDEIKKGKGRR